MRHVQRRISALGGGELLHDLGRFQGRGAEDDLVAGCEDLAAGGVDHRVEPDREPLVLGALLLDVVRLPLRGQLVGLGDHLRPGLGRGRHEILPVPKQLGVRVDRDRPESVLPGRGLDRPGEVFRFDLGGEARRDRLQPFRGCELGSPVDVHREDVDRGVVGGEASYERDSLLVRRRREEADLDVVGAVRALAALGRGRLERARRLGKHVPVERHRALARRAARGKQRGARGGGE